MPDYFSQRVHLFSSSAALISTFWRQLYRDTIFSDPFVSQDDLGLQNENIKIVSISQFKIKLKNKNKECREQVW